MKYLFHTPGFRTVFIYDCFEAKFRATEHKVRVHRSPVKSPRSFEDNLQVGPIFRFRAKEYFRNPDSVTAGFMSDIVRLLKKYDLYSYFSLWINADLLPSYSSWKRIV